MRQSYNLLATFIEAFKSMLSQRYGSCADLIWLTWEIAPTRILLFRLVCATGPAVFVGPALLQVFPAHLSLSLLTG